MIPKKIITNSVSIAPIQEFEGEIIATAHGKGGIGKTTTLWNLIVEFSKERKVKVIDLEKGIKRSFLARKTYGLDIHNIELLLPHSKNEMYQMMKSLKKEDTLFIDTGGYDSGMNRLAIAGATILITPSGNKFYDLGGLKDYEEVLIDISKEIKRKIVTNVLLCKIHRNTRALGDILDFINKSEYFAPMESILRNMADYADSPSVGKSVVEYDPYGTAARDIEELVQEVKTIIAS